MRPAVLVADNDRGVLDLLDRVLSRSGIAVEAREDGGAAWEALTSRSYDLFVCDLNMPKRTGWEILDDLGALDGAPRVVVISGYLDDHAVQDLQARDCVAFVRAKPFDVFRFANDIMAQLRPPVSGSGDPDQAAEA